jgi:hypothetical protein
MPRRKVDPVALMTEICLEFPEAELKPFVGHVAPAFRVRDKIFAKINEDLGGFTCKAPKGVQEQLVEAEPERFYVPQYVGHRGWIGVNFVDVDRDELAAIAEDSYRLTAPKSLLKLLDT